MVEADFEALVGLRILAMRESLEAVGRFSPERVRQRLADSFEASVTRQIRLGDRMAGCVALKPRPEGGLLLEHFYIEPDHQGSGLGSQVLSSLLDEADGVGASVYLTVLVGSPANRFYPRFGFRQAGVEGVDVLYCRPGLG